MNNLTVWKIYCRSLKKKDLQNKVLVYPSESVFALGGNPFSASLLKKIINYKHCKLSKRKGFILLVKDFKSLKKLAEVSFKDYQEIVSSFPEKKPLTFIVKAKATLSKFTFYNSTLAIRVVEDPYLKELVSSLSFPLISTSLNLPKKPSTQSITRARVLSKRKNIKPFIIPYKIFTSKKTSSIYDLTEKKWLR